MLTPILFALSMLFLGVVMFAIDTALRFQTLRALLRGKGSSTGPRGGLRALSRRLADGWRRELGVVRGHVEQMRKDPLEDRSKGLAISVVVGRKE